MYMFLRAMIHVQNELRVDAAGSRWVDVNFTIFMQLSGKVRHYDFCYFHFFYCINLFYLFVDVCCIFCDFIGCCGCPGCHCGYCGCGWRPRPRPRRRCCRYNIYVYYIYIIYITYILYIYICVCMYEHFRKNEHKTSHWHDTHIQGISNLHDPYYIFF